VTSLDPLFRLLVRALATQQPPRIHQPIAINELMDSLLPYRLARRELGVDTSEDYETLLLRLLAGEGDFVQADPAAQTALQAELARPLPDLTMLRVYGDTHVVLRTDPLMAALELRPEERYAPPDERQAPPPEAELGQDVERPSAKDAAPMDRRAAVPWVPDPVVEARAVPPVKPAAARPAAPAELDNSQSKVRCPFCGGLLPPRMMINFCPSCGMGQDAGSCRACGADVDVGWRYCVSCGEEVQGGPS
jgi:hypothetical protein